MDTHNLDISSYSLDDIYRLFHLTPFSDISIDDLKTAKKMVLKLHPDKSRLSSEYFLFYKKALEIIVNNYNEQNKQNKPVVNETYSPAVKGEQDKNVVKQIKKTINSIDQKEFHSKFNKIFEENIIKKQETKNEWFSDTQPNYDFNGENVKRENMSMYIEKVKEQQKNNSLILHKEVENHRSHMGSSLYEDEDDEQEYISAELFSRLKFDDLRKVHKDQTVFSVSENDYISIPKYGSVDEYMRTRNDSKNMDMMSRETAERVLINKERQYNETMMKKQFESQKRTDEYSRINQRVLANFLFLQN